MKQRIFCAIIVCVLSIILLSGCLSQQNVHVESSLPTPTRLEASTSPLQTPPSELSVQEIEPSPGKAVIYGRVEVTQSVLLGELFLAKAVPTSNPSVDLLELDEKKAPRASINRSTDEFVFIDIEPGKYGLIAWEPMNSFPVNDPETGSTLFVEVRANQIIDLGTLYIPGSVPLHLR